MKKLIMGVLIICITVLMSACNDSNTELERNEEIYHVYQLAVQADATDLTYEEWIETVRGPQGEDGRDVTLQVNDGYIRWQYAGESLWYDLIALEDLIGPQGPGGQDGSDGTDGVDGTDGQDGERPELRVTTTAIEFKYPSQTEWTELLALSTLIGDTGASGTDGREIELQASGGFIQWRYVGDTSWTNLVALDNFIANDFYLSDDEINHYLASYASDVTSLLIPLTTFVDQTIDFTQSCSTVDYDDCYDASDYPHVHGENFDILLSKYNKVQNLINMMSLVSDVVGEFDSTPVIPGEFISGGNDFVAYGGRNDTSAYITGAISSSLAYDGAPVEINLEYELLIYKSSDLERIYVEGLFDVVGNIPFFAFSTYQQRFLATYDFDETLIDVVYSTDALGFAAWNTVLVPGDTSLEIYSSNGNDFEYFLIDGVSVEVVVGTDWFEETREFTYEQYGSMGLVQSYDSVTEEFVIPFTQFSGWDLVEYERVDHLIDPDEYMYRISMGGSELQSGITETPDIEQAWVLIRDLDYYYLSADVIIKDTTVDTMVIVTDSQSSLTAFLPSGMSQNGSLNLSDVNTLISYLDTYQYNNFDASSSDFETLYEFFNLN